MARGGRVKAGRLAVAVAGSLLFNLGTLALLGLHETRARPAIPPAIDVTLQRAPQRPPPAPLVKRPAEPPQTAAPSEPAARVETAPAPVAPSPSPAAPAAVAAAPPGQPGPAPGLKLGCLARDAAAMTAAARRACWPDAAYAAGPTPSRADDKTYAVLAPRSLAPDSNAPGWHLKGGGLPPVGPMGPAIGGGYHLKYGKNNKGLLP